MMNSGAVQIRWYLLSSCDQFPVINYSINHDGLLLRQLRRFLLWDAQGQKLVLHLGFGAIRSYRR